MSKAGKLSSRGQCLRFEKGTRYYMLILDKDLLGDWVITKVNGHINSRLGKITHEACSSYHEALRCFKELIWYRQFNRKYGYRHKAGHLDYFIFF